MRLAKVHMRGISPYSQSKVVMVEKLDKEQADDYEKRTWRERMHVNDNGNVLIPPMQLKKCIQEGAKYLQLQVKGKGKSTYTKNFTAGILVMDPIVLPYKKDEVKGEMIHCSSNGKPNGGSRVWKCFPCISEWSGVAQVYVLDELITKDVFETVVVQSGQFIGMGRFRPINGGYYGRFQVEKIVWEDM